MYNQIKDLFCQIRWLCAEVSKGRKASGTLMDVDS